MRKAKCALADIYIEGVKTNLDILHDIIHSQEFTNGACDTQWLEANVLVLLDSGKKILAKSVQEVNLLSPTVPNSSSVAAASNVLFRKGDA